MKTSSDILNKEDLIKIYGYILDEYRFQIKFNWDRVRFLLLLGIGLVSISTGVTRVESDSLGVSLLPVILYTVCVLVCMLGMRVLVIGKVYFYRGAQKLKLCERVLGLNSVLIEEAGLQRRIDLGIETTREMQTRNLTDIETDTSHKGAGPIGNLILSLFFLISVLSVFGAYVSMSTL